MPYIAVEMNCYQPWKTVVRDFPSYEHVKHLGLEWLVYEMETVRNGDGSLIKLEYDDETRTHLKRQT